MNKLLSLFLAVIMLLTLCACSGGPSSGTEDQGAAQTEAAADTTQAADSTQAAESTPKADTAEPDKLGFDPSSVLDAKGNDLFSCGRARVKDGAHVGYINAEGQMAIPAIYKNGTIFSCGLAAVCDESSNWSFIDTAGNTVFDAGAYSEFGCFTSNGLCPAKCDNGLWGYINTKGELAIEPIFYSASNFTPRGTAIVTTDTPEKYNRIINERGEFIDDLGDWFICTDSGAHSSYGWFPSIESNGYGIYKIKEQDSVKFGIYDLETCHATGAIVDAVYYSGGGENVFNCGVANVSIDGRSCYIDMFGNELGGKELDKYEKNCFNKYGYSVIKLDGKIGFIDKDMNVVTEPVYEGIDITTFYGSDFEYCSVELNGKWGFIDRACDLVIEPQFENVKSFSALGGCAPVISGDKWGFIDKTGNYCIEPRFDDVRYYYDANHSNYYYSVLEGDKWGAVDGNGNLIVEPQYLYISPFTMNGYAIMLKDDSEVIKNGGTNFATAVHVIDKTGNIIFDSSVSEDSYANLGLKNGIVESVNNIDLIQYDDGFMLLHSRHITAYFDENGNCIYSLIDD